MYYVVNCEVCHVYFMSFRFDSTSNACVYAYVYFVLFLYFHGGLRITNLQFEPLWLVLSLAAIIML